MKSLKLFSMLMALLAMEFSTASEVEQLLRQRGVELTEKQLSKEQIENIARLMKPKILKDQGMTLREDYDEILHKLKNKNQLFLITHLLNAKEFLKLASTNKEYFDNVGGNLDKLQSHLSRDFIVDFPIYFVRPFPDNTLSVMEYFHIFCLHFGTEYSHQLVDYWNNIYKIDETSCRFARSEDHFTDMKFVNGDLLMSMHVPFKQPLHMKCIDDMPFVWEKDGQLYNLWQEDIRSIFTGPQLDFNNNICTAGRIEANEYKVCMCLTPANFRKYIQHFPPLDL